jgi:ATP-dependent DNA helicase RecQ
VPLTGKLRAPAEPGRALGRLSDVGWGPRLRVLLAAPDAEVPDDVFRAVVSVLGQWRWATRPTQVAWVPSRTRPKLVASLATKLASVGRLQLVGPLVRVRAQRLKSIYAAFSAEGLALSETPLLLVDDVTDSGWTLTEATRVLREAGAGSVLPFVLAIDG